MATGAPIPSIRISAQFSKWLKIMALWNSAIREIATEVQRQTGYISFLPYWGLLTTG